MIFTQWMKTLVQFRKTFTRLATQACKTYESVLRVVEKVRKLEPVINKIRLIRTDKNTLISIISHVHLSPVR